MSARRGRSKKRVSTFADRIRAKEEKYEKVRIQHAIDNCFGAIDEDGNGFIESHEFVVAQSVIAELAGEGFDHVKAAQSFESIRPFDINGDSRVTKQEFMQKMLEICEVLPQSQDALVDLLGERSAQIVNHTRRELATEIRRYFQLADEDSNGTLDQTELAHLEDIINRLSNTGVALQPFDPDDAGKIHLGTFVEHLTSSIKLLKVPKRDIVAKLRELRAP